MSDDKWRMPKAEVLKHALRIAERYDGNLTLRQAYYRFVAEGLAPSGNLVYKRLGKIITDARMNGGFPLEWLMDRARNSNSGKFLGDSTFPRLASEKAQEEFAEMPERWIWRGQWVGQPNHVSVWVEKEALAGVFESPCDELGVSWFACKGYPSISALWQWVQQVDKAMKECDERLSYRALDHGYTHLQPIEEVVVLYFGDHDPDGWEIPRSAERNVRQLCLLRGLAALEERLVFHRVALNMEQIEEFDPPPFDAKMTSTRFEAYVEEHGTDQAWELDALDPDTLNDLIHREVSERFDEDIAEANNSYVAEKREQLWDLVSEPDWMEEARGMRR